MLLSWRKRSEKTISEISEILSLARRRLNNILTSTLIILIFSPSAQSQTSFFNDQSVGLSANIISGIGFSWNALHGKKQVNGRTELGLGWAPFSFQTESISIPICVGLQSGEKIFYGVSVGLSSIVIPWRSIKSRSIRNSYYAGDTVLESGTNLNYYYYPFIGLHSGVRFTNTELLLRLGASAEGTWGIKSMDWFPDVTVKYSFYLSRKQ